MTSTKQAHMAKPIKCSSVYPTLAVPDVETACNWYVERLGFSIRFLWNDPPTHGAVLLDQACLHFWQGTPQLSENWLYFDISDLDEMYNRAVVNCVIVTKPPENYPWGMREFNAEDLNGYKIRFGQHLGEQ